MKTKTCALLIAILNISCFTKALAYELPDLGERSNTILTPIEAKQLSNDVMREISSATIILDDQIISSYIQNLGDKLLKHANAQKQTLLFFVLNDPAINAFSGPGGYIGINSGLIQAANSEGELAAVLAHEIAHTTQHHFERNIENSRKLNLETAAMLAAAVAIGTTTDNSSAVNASTGLALGAIAGGVQQTLNFSREHEAEADHIGMRILYNAGYDPNAMPNFFARLQHLNYDYGEQPPPFLTTHPVTNERIADARNRIAQYTKIPNTNSQEFPLIQARLKALMFHDNHRAIKYFQNLLNTKTKQVNNAEIYGLALALHKDHQTQLALTKTMQLITNDPEQILYKLLLAQIHLTNHAPEKALQVLQNALKIYPSFTPLILQYGQTLIAAKQYKAASVFLTTQVKYFKPKSFAIIWLYNLIANAEAKQGNLAKAYIAKAKVYTFAGNPKRATILLEQALRLPNINNYDKVKIHIELDKLETINKE
jgi:beta-barrel assembly-enhancing protease